MDNYENFLQQMATWLRQRHDLAKAVIQARAEGRHGCKLDLDDGETLWLPEIERDEPDTVQILLHLYSRLQDQQDHQAIYRLRILSVDLFTQGLDSGSDLDSVDRLGGLMSWLHMDGEPELRDALRDQLWGFMVRKNYLRERALSSMAAFHIYYRALDMWLALSYAGAPITAEQRQDLCSVWQREIKPQQAPINNGRDEHSNEYCQFQFLLLLFNIQLEHDQQLAGEQALTQLVLRLQQLPESGREQQRSDLLSLCARLANSNKPHNWQTLETAWVNSTSKDALRNQPDALAYLGEIMQILKWTRALDIVKTFKQENAQTTSEDKDWRIAIRTLVTFEWAADSQITNNAKYLRATAKPSIIWTTRPDLQTAIKSQDFQIVA